MPTLWLLGALCVALGPQQLVMGVGSLRTKVAVMAVIFSSILQHVPSLQLLPLVCPQALTTSYTRSPVFKHLHHYVPSLWSPLVVCPQPDSFMQQCVCVYILHIHTHTHIYTHNTMCCLQKTTPKRAHQPSASSHAPFNNNSIKDVVNLWKKFSKKPARQIAY